MRQTEAKSCGTLTLVSGPMVAATGLHGAAMGEIVRVGELGLMGEVIRIDGGTVYVQVFEDTQGIKLGETVEATGSPLSVELGPGLLGGTFDGIQRSLQGLHEVSGSFIGRGLTSAALDRDRLWWFTPTVTQGTDIDAGDIIGTVPETDSIEHRVMVPPGISGTIEWIADSGEYTVTDVIARVDDGIELTMMHRWPVRTARPISRRLAADKPFLTGQRVLDCLFPISLGGSAIVPGGFGTGKTVVEQTLAKYSNAHVIVYVGCGERGNEMADVLSEFPELEDPVTGRPLMDRTILVVNTSNMPVAARDASVYTGITLAEFYRDMGYDVALMADSTSRWAEALREMSSRLEEMPGEEGYPTYLATRISEFYERAGRVVCACNHDHIDEPRTGSLTLVGAVSPPGGDFSEPVTQTSQRVAGALWALDATLAYRRHYPAINWNRSYSLYFNELDAWFKKHAPAGWCARRAEIAALLQKESELQEVVQLVGPDALQDKERLLLEMGKLIREVFLQQNAFSDEDARSSLEKTGGLMEVLLLFREKSAEAIDRGVRLDRVLELSVREELAQLREVANERFEEEKLRVVTLLREEFDSIADG
ncbi:MAG: V-type ATP synthase subunit A [Candidatus Hydrogenedentes bacterium]|nr:V-type ATP synthase subunit A [Candidatus Hydrogenedentota bacterium]